MRALVARQYGGLDALAIVVRDDPAVGADDVRIAVRAASLNPIDFTIREGKLDQPASAADRARLRRGRRRRAGR
jgi:NADPH:quinone reductase-like Zn-dependent oxidoreductase